MISFIRPPLKEVLTTSPGILSRLHSAAIHRGRSHKPPTAGPEAPLQHQS
jgi:hypothetical protein